MGKLGSSAGCQLHHILTFASACADTVQVNVFTEKFKESQALHDFRHNCTPTWLFIASGCIAAALEIIIGILAIYAMCPVERRESRWIIVHMVREVDFRFLKSTNNDGKWPKVVTCEFVGLPRWPRWPCPWSAMVSLTQRRRLVLY